MRQSWDSSQIADRDEEDVVEWHEEDELKEQCEEDEKMEKSLEREKLNEDARQVEDLQKVPELVAHQRMSQCEKVFRVKRKEERK